MTLSEEMGRVLTVAINHGGVLVQGYYGCRGGTFNALRRRGLMVRIASGPKPDIDGTIWGITEKGRLAWTGEA